jgi:hypothetical protein
LMSELQKSFQFLPRSYSSLLRSTSYFPIEVLFVYKVHSFTCDATCDWMDFFRLR